MCTVSVAVIGLVLCLFVILDTVRGCGSGRFVLFCLVDWCFVDALLAIICLGGLCFRIACVWVCLVLI